MGLSYLLQGCDWWDHSFFELTYGLNAILPIDFLVPTLPVAKELEWIGHELSSRRVYELEQLDETRLLAIAGMYAEKCCCKHWHD